MVFGFAVLATFQIVFWFFCAENIQFFLFLVCIDLRVFLFWHLVFELLMKTFGFDFFVARSQFVNFHILCLISL